MKTITKTSKTLLSIILILFSTTSCKPQNKTDEQLDQQAIEQRDSTLVYRDSHGTKEEELQGQLQLALGNNDIVELSVLIQKGANTNKLPGNTDITPLMLAETKKIATLLLDNGAKPLVIDATGKNLLHYAVTKENAFDLIPLYVSLGVDTNAQDHEKNTPLSLAIDYFYEINAFDSEPVFVGKEETSSANKEFKRIPYKTLEALVKAGADLNAFDQYGYTLLMDCVTKDNPKLIKILLELGADKGIRNQYDETAKDIAYKAGQRYIYQLLE